MNTITSFKDLIVWQKGIILAKEIYSVTEKFPKSEIYGLSSQMQRAAISVSSNIAEGRYRGSKKEFVQFLRIAYGSCAELYTQLHISKELSFVSEKDYNTVVGNLDEISRILNVMIKKFTA